MSGPRCQGISVRVVQGISVRVVQGTKESLLNWPKESLLSWSKVPRKHKGPGRVKSLKGWSLYRGGSNKVYLEISFCLLIILASKHPV